MLMLACDLARKFGYAIGEAGKKPLSGSFDLRPFGGSVYDDPGELAFKLSFLTKSVGRPDLIAVEEPLEAHALWRMTGRGGAGAVPQSHSIKAQMLLHGGLYAWARVSRISVRRVAANTVRAHVCGKMSDGSRDKTKQMVLERVKALGLVPPDCKDTDQADAVAIWAWAQDVIANVRGPLVLMS